MQVDETADNEFGKRVRSLMELRSISGEELAGKLSLSQTAISKILHGKNRPRQHTFAKLCETLCQTDEERWMLVSAYTGLNSLPQSTPPPAGSTQAPRLDDLEYRAAGARLERTLVEKLEALGCSHIKAPYIGNYKTDILIEYESKRIALECHIPDFQPMKLEGLGDLLRALEKSDDCDHAYAIIPKETQIQYMKLKNNAELMSIDYLIDTVLKLRAPKKGR